MVYYADHSMPPTHHTLTILIPAYNEAPIIQDTLDTIQTYLRARRDLYTATIVVVDDGSTDATKSIVQSIPDIRYLGYAKNAGKGYALKYAIERIQTDYVYVCDADLSVSIDQLETFWRCRHEANAIIGSRQHPRSAVAVSWYRKLLGNAGNILIRYLLGLVLTDTQCGFKLFDRRAQAVFVTHTTHRWGFDFDVLLRLKRAGLSVQEVPVTWVAGAESKMTIGGYITTLRELISLWKKLP